MGDFGGDIRLYGVIVKVTGRVNLFWTPPTQGYKLGPPEGLTDPIRNVRNVKKTPEGVILKERVVLMGLLSEYQGDSTCPEFLVTRATNLDHPEASLTPSGLSRRPIDG